MPLKGGGYQLYHKKRGKSKRLSIAWSAIARVRAADWDSDTITFPINRTKSTTEKKKKRKQKTFDGIADVSIGKQYATFVRREYICCFHSRTFVKSINESIVISTIFIESTLHTEEYDSTAKRNDHSIYFSFFEYSKKKISESLLVRYKVYPQKSTLYLCVHTYKNIFKYFLST